MTRARSNSPRRLRELASVVVLVAVLIASQQWLPADGWGLALRRAIGVLLTVAVVVSLAGVAIATVREFRRGLAEKD